MSGQTISFTTIWKQGLDKVDDGDALDYSEIAGLRGSLLPKDRNFYAIVGNGDDHFDLGETAHKLGDMRGTGRIENVAQSATDDDPVSIHAHGLVTARTLGDLTDALMFRDGAIGLDNYRDGPLRAGFLNSGDSLTFDTRDPISSIRFVADLAGNNRGTGELLFDLDGNVVRAGTKPGSLATDALVRLAGIHDGDSIELDFANHQLRVNGAASATSASALFDAFEAGAGASITIGAFGGRPLSLGHVSIDTAPDEPQGTGVLTSPTGSPFSFGTVLHGLTGTTFLEIANTGDGTASNIQVSFDGPFGYQTGEAALPDSLAPGEVADFHLQFNAPDTPGAYEGGAEITWYDGHATETLSWDFTGFSL